MGLFGPVWKGKNKEKALAWVKGESDQGKLARAALEANLADVRSAAVRKVEDQAVLAKAAVDDPSWEVRDAAAWRLDDQETLKRIAGQDPSGDVRISALLRIRDEMYLVAYAAQIHNDRLARTAMEHVKSPEALAVAAATSGWSGIVRNCLKKIGPDPSEEVLAILRQGKDPQVREYLIPYQSSAEREKTALKDADRNNRRRAIFTLDSWEVLYRAATEDSDASCRRAAFERLGAIRKTIPDGWWAEHITEGVRDQMLPVRIRKGIINPDAAKEAAEEIANGRADALFPIMTMPAVDALEKLASGGNKDAVKALYKLYKSDTLNPELSGHAAEQKKRFYSEHVDRMVDSSVCGETYRHDDYVRDETIRPL